MTEQKADRGLSFSEMLVFALAFNALLWLTETVIFFIKKIDHPGIWFYVPWKSLGLYLILGAIFVLIAEAIYRIFRRRSGPRGAVFCLRIYLALTLLAYVLSLYLFDLRTRVAPHWYSFKSLIALAVLIAGTLALCFGLSRLTRSVLRRKGKALFPAGVAVLVAGFGLFNAVFDINDIVIPTTVLAKGTPGPNLVLILVDTLRPDYLGCYGNAAVRTPNIDRLAADGILFRECIVQAPWTLPSLGSILTSKYPSQHGAERLRILEPNMVREDKVFFDGALRADQPTIFEILKDNGYATAVFQPNITAASFRGFNQGVDYFFDAFKYHRLIFEDAASVLSRDRLNDFFYPGFSYADNRKMIRYAGTWLRRNSHNKVCLFIMLFDCHEYYLEAAGRSQKKRFEFKETADAERLKRAYATSVEKTDRDIGVFLDVLRNGPRFDQTAVVLSADHGESLFDHSRLVEDPKAYYDIGLYHGQTFYDEILKVPLIMRLPMVPNLSKEFRPQARSIDILPTLVSLFSLKTPASFEGVDLSRNRFDGLQDLPAFSESVLEYPEVKSLRKDGWKLIYHPAVGVYELYDLRGDPKERVNLAAVNIEMRDQLSRELTAWMERMANEKAKNAASEKKRELTRKEKDALKSLGYIK